MIITLSNGSPVLVDDEDYDELSQWNWWPTSDGYAARQVGAKRTANFVHILMHRFVLGMPKTGVVDHINRNKLDNRRSNLRLVGTSQNMHNTGLWATNTSGHKGVSWNRSRNRWRAYIGVGMSRIELGHFTAIDDAIAARAAAEERFAEECGFIA